MYKHGVLIIYDIIQKKKVCILRGQGKQNRNIKSDDDSEMTRKEKSEMSRK